MKTCEVCGVQNNTVSTEPSARQLIFGSFRNERGLLVTYQDRCQKCEKKLTAKLMKMLEED